MSKAQESFPQLVSGIHINLTERSVTFEVDKQPVVKLTLAPHGVIFFQPPSTPPVLEGVVESSDHVIPPPTAPQETREKPQTVTLTGRLKTQPKEGKPDSRGNPTAWARLAVHEEGRDDAHFYLATFHRHTAKIAVGLSQNAQVTVEGYPHPAQEQGRMDTFSVINLVNYPGKPEKSKG